MRRVFSTALAGLFLYCCPVLSAPELPVVKLSPTMKPQSSEQSRFQRMDCSALGKAKPLNAAEQEQLENRKQQCLKKYRVFIPQS